MSLGHDSLATIPRSFAARGDLSLVREYTLIAAVMYGAVRTYSMRKSDFVCDRAHHLSRSRFSVLLVTVYLYSV